MGKNFFLLLKNITHFHILYLEIPYFNYKNDLEDFFKKKN